MPSRIGPFEVVRKLGGVRDGRVGKPTIRNSIVAWPSRRSGPSSPRIAAIGISLQEGRAAARLQDNNVVAVYQAEIAGDLLYLVMEFVNGCSLEKLVSVAKPMTWRAATLAVRNAAKGLAAAQLLNLVHRDIKPANLMQSAGGVTKVADFGLAGGVRGAGARPRVRRGHSRLHGPGSLATPTRRSGSGWPKRYLFADMYLLLPAGGSTALQRILEGIGDTASHAVSAGYTATRPRPARCRLPDSAEGNLQRFPTTAFPVPRKWWRRWMHCSICRRNRSVTAAPGALERMEHGEVQVADDQGEVVVATSHARAVHTERLLAGTAYRAAPRPGQWGSECGRSVGGIRDPGRFATAWDRRICGGDLAVFSTGPEGNRVS